MTIRILVAGAAWVFAAAWLATPARAAHPNPPTVPLASCSWDRPGHDPFTGDVVAAVDRYRDLAPDVRERLKARMARRDYDDMVSIGRDRITGKARYGSTIRDMHFGAGRVCHSVTRASWTPSMQERGLVYCEGAQCILVPTVCRNVSRITRAQVSPEHAEGPPEGPAGGDADMPGDAPIVIAATAAPGFAATTGPSFAVPEGIEAPLRRGGPIGGAEGVPAPLPSLPDGRPSGSSGDAMPPVFIGLPGWDGPVFLPAGAAPIAEGSPPMAAAVPEPETWVLMLSGLAALGWTRRQRWSRLACASASRSTFR